MGKVVKAIGNAFSSVLNEKPKMPAPAPVAPMADEQAVARRRAIAAAKTSSGRTSTVLTDDTFGG